MRILLLSLLCLIPICAAPPQGGRGPRNLKLLKPDEVREAMRSYTVALGVQCTFCHVQDRSSDENPHKNMARHMIEMTRDINSKFPDGKEHVTCFTCHRGAQEPLMAPAAQ